jgi:uncharacterized protein DUF7025/ATPase family protein associated with various cellular activities (AAA)
MMMARRNSGERIQVSLLHNSEDPLFRYLYFAVVGAKYQTVAGPSLYSHTVETPGYIVIHHVSCMGSENHSLHPRQSSWLDVPRLYAGDDKAACLRGRLAFINIGQYDDGYSDVHFFVHKNYDCIEYCNKYTDRFDLLLLKQVDSIPLSEEKVYFFSLREDGCLAKPRSEEIEIKSQVLRESMESLMSQFPKHFHDWGDMNLKEPCSEFYHGQSILEDYVTTPSNLGPLPDIRQCFKFLFDYVKQRYGSEWDDANTMFDKGLVASAHFSKLFGPDQIVVKITNGEPMGYLCQNCVDRDGNGRSLELECWSWAFDSRFYRLSTTLNVTWPGTSGTMPIVDLQVYPLKYDVHNIEQRLRTRGQKFWNCRHGRFVAYEGYDVPYASSYPRFMIDMAMYIQLHARELAQQDDLSPKTMYADSPPDDPFVLLLPSKIRGYGFVDKEWIDLSVENFRSVVWNIDAFDQSLVLMPRMKEIIKALVTTHTSNDVTTVRDFDAKRMGLVILLHGAPGTGKTLTAECVAELAQRPLYRITCGDLGTDPGQLEKSLKSAFSTWSKPL